MLKLKKAESKVALIRGTDKKSKDDHFYILDIENMKVDMLDLPELEQVNNAGFCWVKDSTYLVCGGFIRGKDPEEASDKAFLLDISARKLTPLPNMTEPQHDCHPVYENGVIYNAGSPIPRQANTLIVSMFDQKANTWTQLSKKDFPVNGIVRTFKNKNELVIITYRTFV